MFVSTTVLSMCVSFIQSFSFLADGDLPMALAQFISFFLLVGARLGLEISTISMGQDTCTAG